MSTSRTVHLELTDRQTEALRDALVEEMARTCKIVRGYLRDHLGGSNVGLVDARGWLRILNELAGVMEQLDAPGWREALGKLEAVS